MYKLTVKLKQHTPLIHFQHEQHGATLRATELKPKLDRFLIDIFKKQKTDYSGYLIGNGTHEAMDYKVNIVCEGEIKVNSNIHRLFFGNMGDENLQNPKQTVFTNEPIRLVIQSFHEKLLSEIQLHIADFFANTNFGTRQSKGFGSFYLHEKDALYKPVNLSYRFFVDVRNAKGIELNTMFDYIDVFYKALRSGINLKGRDRQTVFYIKPFIFHYAKNQQINEWKQTIQWDKKTIKETYFHNILNQQKQQQPNSEQLNISAPAKYLLKDLFGLSTSEDWRFPYKANIQKEHINKEIERFSSPLFFKPIRQDDFTFVVHLKANTVPNVFLDKKFKILNNGRGNLTIDTPPTFDFPKFLDFVFSKNIKLYQYVDKPSQSHKNYRILEQILNQ